jgi:hypothetical protein
MKKEQEGDLFLHQLLHQHLRCSTYFTTATGCLRVASSLASLYNPYITFLFSSRLIFNQLLESILRFTNTCISIKVARDAQCHKQATRFHNTHMTSELSGEGGFELRGVVKPLALFCRHLVLLARCHLFSRQATRNSDVLYTYSVVAFGLALSL